MCDIGKEINEEIGTLIKNKWLPSNEDNTINQIKESIKECIEKYNTKNYKGTPAKEDIFNAFKIGKNEGIINPEDVKILILGQDPYPEIDRAQGLAFSFKNGEKSADDSLLNIFKAIKANKENIDFDTVDVEKIKGNIKMKIQPWNTNLKTWASNNGVLLLNTALTYKENEKHFNAWNPFIKQIISNLINNMDKNNKLAVFLWGVPAQNLFYEAIKNKKERFSVFIEYYEKNSKNKDGKVGKKLIQSYCYQINNLKIFLTSHPSKQGFWRGFKNVAPNHFDCCDKFLGKYIWKNFPDNNKKQ